MFRINLFLLQKVFTQIQPTLGRCQTGFERWTQLSLMTWQRQRHHKRAQQQIAIVFIWIHLRI
jgi:hypothetical protein